MSVMVCWATPPFEITSGATWPAFAYSTLPVLGSSTPATMVTNFVGAVFGARVAFISCMRSAGDGSLQEMNATHLLHEIGRRRIVAREDVERRGHAGHHQRRGDPLPAHVGDDEVEPPVRTEQHVEVIAAHGAARLVRAGEVVAVDDRQRRPDGGASYQA